jgi:hypothetical protein
MGRRKGRGEGRVAGQEEGWGRKGFGEGRL